MEKLGSGTPQVVFGEREESFAEGLTRALGNLKGEISDCQRVVRDAALRRSIVDPERVRMATGDNDDALRVRQREPEIGGVGYASLAFREHIEIPFKNGDWLEIVEKRTRFLPPDEEVDTAGPGRDNDSFGRPKITVHFLRIPLSPVHNDHEEGQSENVSR